MSQPSLPLEESASDLSDVLDEMDDYIDEALAFNGQNVGPTPPKQDRKSPIVKTPICIKTNLKKKTLSGIFQFFQIPRLSIRI